MRLHSYVIRRDYGFAPNPFHGMCSLATCKKLIRRHAHVGDWVIATGSAQYERAGQLVCAMKVSETMSFDGYWSDPRFQAKKPVINGSRMMGYGDNIYHHAPDGGWVQADSHHSLEGGVANPKNLNDDTETDRVLIADEFWYFGSSAPTIPPQLRGDGKADICVGRGHKVNFVDGLVDEFVAWVTSLPSGCRGRPDRWPG
jgi:hypothetical protein